MQDYSDLRHEVLPGLNIQNLTPSVVGGKSVRAVFLSIFAIRKIG